MRRILIGALVAIVLVVGFVAVRLGGTHEAAKALDQSFAQLPPGYTATHGATDYDAITGTLTVHDLVLSQEGRKLGSAGLLVVTGAHSDALRAVFDPASYPDGKPAWSDRRDLLGHVEVTTLQIESADPGTAPLLVRHLRLNGLRGRPFIRPPTAANRSAQDFQIDAARDLAFKDAAIEGLELLQDGQGHLKIAREEITDYDGGKVGGAQIADVELTAQKPQNISLSLAKFAIGPGDFSPTLASLAATTGEDPAQRRREALQAWGKTMQAYSFTVAGFAFKQTPGPRVELASLEAVNSATSSEGVRTGSGTLRGLTIAAADATIPPPMQAMMQRFGRDAVTVDIDLKATEDQTAHTLAMQTYDIVFRDLGTLKMSGTLTGYDREAFRNVDPKGGPAASLRPFQTMSIEHGLIEWDDASLTRRVLDVVAAQRGTTPDALVAGLAMPLRGLAMVLPDQPDAGQQVLNFLQNKHSLRITMEPPAPTTFGDVGAAPLPAKAHLLGVKITGL